MAATNGSGNDPVIDGAEPFNGSGDGTGGSPDGGSQPERNEHGAIKPESIVEKRGRGRPRKDGTSGTGSGEATGSGKSGGKTQGQSRGANLDVEIFATQLQGFHAILAKLSKNDIWNITSDEAKKLAKAIKEIMALHQITIPSKYLVYGQLFAVCAAIYGPRLAIMALQQKAEREKNASTFDAATGAPVTP